MLLKTAQRIGDLKKIMVYDEKNEKIMAIMDKNGKYW
jgi:hypothetical protein